jgi:NAD(P)-dependent dehydrogenase (short-subunit alcohol dehydrogenase family)
LAAAHRAGLLAAPWQVHGPCSAFSKIAQASQARNRPLAQPGIAHRIHNYKTAVITGGTEGIGLATAKTFVREGAYVFITGRRQKELDEAVEAIGTNVSAVQGDVAQLADLDRLYETVAKVKGRIDIVFANAGVGDFVSLGSVTEEHFDKLFNINVRGTLFTVQKGLAATQ